MSASDTVPSRKRKRSTEGSEQSVSSDVHQTIEISGNARVHMGDQYFLSRDAEQEAIDSLTKSLHFPQMLRRHENIREQHRGTYEWIFNTSKKVDWYGEDTSDIPWKLRAPPPWDPFMDWLQGDQSIYWISGKPGSGKSTLMKFLVDHVQASDDKGQHPHLNLSFWFWEAGQELERNLEGCVQSLLWQCLQYPLTRRLAYDKIYQNIQGFSWTRSRLVKSLKSCLSAFQQAKISVRVFLDGLDESGSDASDILELFTDLPQRINTVKLCISSRPEQSFVDELSNYPKLRLQDLNAKDISKVIREDFLQNTKVARLLDGRDKVGHGLKMKLIDKAQGVFLWVTLAIRSLVRGLTHRDSIEILEARLEQLPEDLDNLYGRMLGRTEADMKMYKEDAAFCFRLLFESPLSILGLCFAKNENLRNGMFDPPFDLWDDEDLDKKITSAAEEVQSWVTIRTGGLLEITKDERASFRCEPLECLSSFAPLHVDFIHRTVRTYLLDTKSGDEILSACSLTQSEVEDICSEVLLIEEFILRALNRGFPNMTYMPGINYKPRFLERPYTSTGADLALAIWTELSRRGLLECTRTLPSSLPDLIMYSRVTAFPSTKEGVIDACQVCCRLGWFEHAQELLSESNLKNVDVPYLSTLLLFAFCTKTHTPDPDRTIFIQTVLDLGGDPLYEFHSKHDEKISILPLLLMCNETEDVNPFLSESIVQCAQWWSAKYRPSIADIDYQLYDPFIHRGKSTLWLLTATLNLPDIMKLKRMATVSSDLTVPSRVWIVRYLGPNCPSSHVHLSSVTNEESDNILLMLRKIMTELPATDVVSTYVSLFRGNIAISHRQTSCQDGPCLRLIELLRGLIKSALPIRNLFEASSCVGKSEEAVRRYVADKDPERRLNLGSEFSLAEWKSWVHGPVGPGVSRSYKLYDSCCQDLGCVDSI